MTEKYIMGRNEGKTTLLLRRSAEENIPIVCNTKAHANYVKEKAKELKLSIPEPIVPIWFTRTGQSQANCVLIGTKVDKVLIDDADIFLNTVAHHALGVDVAGFTMTDPCISVDLSAKKKPIRVWSPWHRTSDGIEYATDGKSVKVRVEQYSVNLGKIVRIGRASCSPYDDFDLNTGIRVAFLRAKQKVCKAYQNWVGEKIKEAEEGFIPEFIHHGGSL